MFVAGNPLGSRRISCGVFLVGANHEAQCSVKRPGLDIFRIAPRRFVH